MFKTLLTVLLFATSLAAQTGIVVTGSSGNVKITGAVNLEGPPGTPPPPPPNTIQAQVFGGIYNSTNVGWPPKDGSGNPLLQGGCRDWDSANKIGQIMSVSGPMGSETFSFNWTAFDNLYKRCKGITFSGAPNSPMKFIYTMGATPCGAALGPYNEPGTGAITNCPQLPQPNLNTGGCLQPDFAFACAAYRDNVTGSASESDKTILTFTATLFSHAQGLGGTVDYIELQNEPDISSGGFQCWNQASACGSPVQNPHTTVNAPMLKALVQRGWDVAKERDCKSPTTLLYAFSTHQTTILPGEIFDNFINSSTTVHALTHGVNGYPSSCPDIPSQVVFGWQVVDVMNMHPDGNPNTPEALINSDINLECERTSGGCGHTHAGSAWTHLVGLPKAWNEYGSKQGDCTTNDCLAGQTARRYALCAILSYIECDYYQMDSNGAFTALLNNLGGTAYNAVAAWMIGGVTDPFTSPVGAVYTESFTNASSDANLLVWTSTATDANNGYTCNNTVGGTGCTTVVVPNGYTKFQSIDGVLHNVNGSHQIAVGGKPVCVTSNPLGC